MKNVYVRLALLAASISAFMLTAGASMRWK
jgi:hypothetical protein